MPNKVTKKERYFSLVWKTVLAVSFATVAASSSVFVFGKMTLDNNYSLERLKTRQFYTQAFQSILQRSKLDDVNIGWLIPAFLDPNANSSEALNQIKKLIEANWFKIELESDIEAAYLLSKEGELIGEWGATVGEIDYFAPLFKYVIENEKPTDQILCANDCSHIYVSPFLHKGEFIGVFIFAIDLAETVIQMQGITGADIGILINQSANGDQNKLPALEKWSKNIIALTQYNKNLNLLSALMNLTTKGDLEDVIEFNFKGKSYEISTIPFAGNINQAELVIIDDITHELAEIRKATVLYAANGLISLFLSGGLLLLLLIGPTRRLRVLIALLPLIAEKKYIKVMKYLPKKIKRSYFKDEIDVLDEATHNLMMTLKKLDLEVELRTERLSEKTIELQKEKNFVSNILNAAQVIIMTLNDKGQILSINKYGENLTGLNEPALINHFFTELIFEDNTITSALNELVENRSTSFHKECTIYSKEGHPLYISWFFTLIINPDQTPEILVVGLDLTERNKIESDLAWLADHDPLTNLYNRRRFEKELQKTLAMANRYNQSGALIYFDIDQFKFINDSSGHKVGDELLVKVAEKLSAITRGTDLVARFGGDEFVVLAPQINQQNAEELIKKICLEMKQVEISAERSIHRVSISAGLLIFPTPGYTEQDLMASVDLAMYKAKEAGRGGWCLASTDDLNRDEVRTRVNWKSNIEKALKENRFVLYFQPIMKIVDKSISHYECLLRMIDDKGNIVPPGLFISVAEQTGLMTQIDQKVLELSIRHQADFIANELDIVLSVNLSGEMFSNPEAFNIVSELLYNYQVPASRFIFEVTESQAVTNLQSAQNFMRKIINIGGKFALDDFGVGFSSMNHLKQLPINFLKIDGGFVKNIADNRDDKLFVNAINSVGQGMGITTIAEFVENEKTVEALFLIGVDYAQGYWIGRPMPKPEFHLVNDSMQSISQLESNSI